MDPDSIRERRAELGSPDAILIETEWLVLRERIWRHARKLDSRDVPDVAGVWSAWPRRDGAERLIRFEGSDLGTEAMQLASAMGLIGPKTKTVHARTEDAVAFCLRWRLGFRAADGEVLGPSWCSLGGRDYSKCDWEATERRDQEQAEVQIRADLDAKTRAAADRLNAAKEAARAAREAERPAEVRPGKFSHLFGVPEQSPEYEAQCDTGRSTFWRDLIQEEAARDREDRIDSRKRELDEADKRFEQEAREQRRMEDDVARQRAANEAYETEWIEPPVVTRWQAKLLAVLGTVIAISYFSSS